MVKSVLETARVLPSADMSPVMATTFWKTAGRTDFDKCWVWTGSQTNGYGRLDLNGRLELAHRVAYALITGVSVRDLGEIRRLCNQRLCCNPEHLYEATDADEEPCRAKLTPYEVEDIRNAASEGRTYASLADQYGLSARTIAHACQGRTWVGVPGPIKPPQQRSGTRPVRSVYDRPDARNVSMPSGGPNAERDTEIIRMRLAGWSIHDISVHVRIAQPTVSKVLKRSGIGRFRARRSLTKF